MKNTLAFLLLLPLVVAPLRADGPAIAAPKPAGMTSAAVFEPHPGAVAADTVTADMVGKDVVISGTIAKFEASRGERSPSRLTLVDRASSPVLVVYWPDFEPKAFAAGEVPAVGKKISAQGKLEEFKGALQIRVREVGDLRVEGMAGTLDTVVREKREGHEPPAPKAIAVVDSLPLPGADGYYEAGNVGAFKPLIGKKINLKGKVTAFRAKWSDRSPNSVTIGEGSNTVDVVYWAAEGEEAAPLFDKVGENLYVSGTLQEFKGKTQLNAKEAQFISYQPLPADKLAPPPKPKALTNAPPAADKGWPGVTTKPKQPGVVKASVVKQETLPASEPVRAADLGAGHAGNTVTIRGRIVKVLYQEGARRVIINDGSGQISVSIPKGIDTPIGTVGNLRASGKVEFDKVRSQPTIVVDKAADLAIEG